MNRILITTLVLLFCGLATAVIAGALALSRANRELEQLTQRVDRLDARQKAPPTQAPAPALHDLQQKVAHLERKVGDRPQASGSPAAALTPQPAPPPGTITEQDIQKIVDQKVQEKLQGDGGKKNGGDDRKVPLRDIAKELPLDGVAEGRMAEISNRAKDEIFLLAKTLRPDGTTLADEILDAALSGNEEKTKQSFMKIFSEKVPGTDKTYLAIVGEIQDRARATLQQIMTPEAWTRFQHMSVKPENIETGYDPWAEYLKQRR